MGLLGNVCKILSFGIQPPYPPTVLKRLEVKQPHLSNSLGTRIADVIKVLPTIYTHMEIWKAGGRERPFISMLFWHKNMAQQV